MKIYVGNLSRVVTESDMRQAFEAFGQVMSALILKDKFSGEPRGFGFVEMPSAGEAEAAIAGLNGTELGGQTLKVNEARPKADRPRFGGNGGGRSGGGDRRGGNGGGFGGPRRSSRF